MEKIQCDTCGSFLFIKLDDDIFECQSCGSKFKKNAPRQSQSDIRKAMESMRNEEAKNLIEYADGLYESKNYSEAVVYYNKALAIDSNNQHCHKQLKKIEEYRQRVTVGFVKPGLTTKECERYFLHWLKYRGNIPVDIYEKLTILSVTEAFYSYGVCSYNISGDFSAVAMDDFGFSSPWTGRYTAKAEGKVYCHNMFLADQHLSVDHTAFEECTLLQYSPQEYSELSNYEGIPVKKEISLRDQAYSKAEEHCKHMADKSIEGTSVKSLKNIETRHETCVFNYQEMFLPFCVITYKYEGKEYYWIMCLKKGETFYSGTYPSVKVDYENTKINFSQRCLQLEKTAQEKVDEIDRQLDVLDQRIANIGDEKAIWERQMAGQMNIKRPWKIDASVILILIVPIVGFVGYVITSMGYVLGHIILAFVVGLVLLCVINFIRNRLIVREAMEAQQLYNDEYEEISNKEEGILAKINETKTRLLAQRESVIREYTGSLEQLNIQNMEPIIVEIARKLSADSFTFVGSSAKNNHAQFYRLPFWIEISKKESVCEEQDFCWNVSPTEITKKRTAESECEVLCEILY